ncbi:MAG TPA: mevalonate kinase, partial [Blastocatellia bacterium]|nr:mevalonate kinase [Blastocatellia bacterium]
FVLHMHFLRHFMKMASPKKAKTQHIGFGKLIIFGEHFVVHNQRPALVGALEAYSTCDVHLEDANAWSTGLIVVDDRAAVPGYKDEKKDEMLESTKLVLKHFGIDHEKRAVRVHFGGPLCAVSGVGASAASCVALSRALNDVLGKNMNEEQINAAAFEGEKGYHGTPSGIDNTAATYGGLLRFQRSAVAGGSPIFEPQKLDIPCLVVYASTGITSSTTEVVGDVRKKKDANPAWYEELQTRYDGIYEKGLAALKAGRMAEVGQLCDQNHALLQELGVSCKELDDLVVAARKAGAAGAKLAGTGRGGLMFAVCVDEASQKKVFDALSKVAPQCWMTKFA